MIYMKKYLIVVMILVCGLSFTACNKLQEGYDYNRSFYDTELNKSVMDFMQSRTDIFSGMLAAIEYVDQEAAYKDVKQMYATTGNTFLLLHNNALTNLEDANSYWSLHKVMGPDPNNPSQQILVKGSDWSQYDRAVVADMLRYHVLKGEHTYATL